MNPELTEKLIVAIVGAIVGWAIAFISNTFNKLQGERTELDRQKEIQKIREQLFDELKSMYGDAQQSLSAVNYSLDMASKSAQKINAVREQAEKIVADIKVGTGVNTQDIADILKPELLLKLESLFKESFSIQIESALKESFIIQKYETRIDEMRPISEGPNPWVWEKFVTWNIPLKESPRAAFLGHIYGHNCAQVIITIGFINQQGFALYVYNPTKQIIKPVDLNVKILAIK